MVVAPWAMVRGQTVTVMVASAHDSTVPLEGRYPYHVAENGQELVHGCLLRHGLDRALAFLLKRV
jgi:hypothetical protein